MTEQSQPLYAVIDLGSNSFHMLITRLVAESVQVVDKVKRKVRLASGLDETLNLDKRSMGRGWECLSFFAERLQDIPPENIRIVATATLRIALNADTFIKKAEQILGHKINVISGEQEARHIYLGVAHTNCSADERLVIDIGGASTEIIIGSGFDVAKVCSLNMGCVTYNQRFFSDSLYSKQQFELAVTAAKRQLATIAAEYQAIGWQVALGGSGTFQAIIEVMKTQGQQNTITRQTLELLEKQIVNCGSLDGLTINGLAEERKPVFASGIAILSAIFDTLKIETVELAGGALREGVLYELLPNMRNVNIRQRTLQGLIQKFHLDVEHAKRVTELAAAAFQQLSSLWHTNELLAISMLKTACAIHEIGLLLEYKRNRQHAVYIIENSDLPGFAIPDRELLVALVGNYKDAIDCQSLHNQTLVSNETARLLLMVLRLAIILCKRRQDDVLPAFELTPDADHFMLSLPVGWLAHHPLIAEELIAETKHLAKIGIELTINSGLSTD